jgi:hypothetical protein
MGGWGSGRRQDCVGSPRGTVDGYQAVDVNWLARHCYLRPGCSANLSWSRDGESLGSIRIEARGTDGRTELVVFHYRSQANSHQWEDVEQVTLLTWTPCHFGGSRPWFLCAGSECHRRVGKLYAAGKFFLCRRCYGLVYESQRANARHRALYRARKFRERLGGSANLTEPFPEKPKGLHWDTYERLRDAALDAQQRFVGPISAWLRREKAALGRSRP